MVHNRSLGKRMLSAVLAASMSAAMLPSMATSLPQIAHATGGEASETDTEKEQNAASALGLDQSAPAGYDEDSRTKNPYGRQNIAFSGADEVLVGDMGSSGWGVIGYDTGADVGKAYELGDDEERYKAISYYSSSNFTKNGILDTEGTYISELALATSESILTNNDYKLVYYDDEYVADLNKGARGPNIYLGYKTTPNAKEAITDVKIVLKDDPALGGKEPTSDDLYMDFDGVNCKYTLAKYNFDGNDSDFKSSRGDLNKGNSGNRMYLYTTHGYSVPSKPSLTEIYVDGKEYGSLGDTNKNNVGSHMYVHIDKEERYEVNLEGKTFSGNNVFQQKKMVNKTAGGNFDGNKRGLKKQFAMVAYDPEIQKLRLGIFDADYQYNTTMEETKTLGFNKDNAIAWNNGVITTDTAKCNVQATAMMQIAAGDFDNNGTDDIAVYNPAASDGARVEVYYSRGNTYDINTWEMWTKAVPKDSVVSLAVGDYNNDGIDDLAIAYTKNVTVYMGSGTDALATSYRVDADLYDPSVTTYNPSAGSGVTTLAVLGVNDDTKKLFVNGSLMVFSFNSFDKKFAKITENTEIEMLQPGGTYDEDDSAYKMLHIPLELHSMNGNLYSPYFTDGYRYNGKELTVIDVDFDHSLTIYTGLLIRAIAYDFQTTRINPTGSDTDSYEITFFKLISSDYFLQGAYSEGFSGGPTMPVYMTRDFSKPTVYAIVNFDNDSNALHYTGQHSYEYTEPQILAVLASPPYFKDLLENDKLSGGYSGSSTSFSRNKETGTEISQSATISAGFYTKWQANAKIMGINLGGIESELEMNASFTEEYSQSESLSFEDSYTTSAGEDAVIFYSIPVEHYLYEIYDKETNETAYRELSFPKKASVSTVSLEEYRRIAENYSQLPEIDDSVLKHTLGEPSTYPTSTEGYVKPLEFNGHYGNVKYSGSDGGIHEQQTISMSSGSGTAYSGGVDISFSIGFCTEIGGAGIKVGASASAGKATTSTDGCSFSADMCNMPQEADGYGYGMSWKLFSHEGSYLDKTSNQTVTYPVVDYLVSDVTEPPRLPENFRQNYQESTHDSITLEWNYSDISIADEFRLFRVTTIAGERIKTPIGILNVLQGEKQEDGTYSYRFIDDGTDLNGGTINMEAGQMYTYCIDARRSKVGMPPLSMPSNDLNAYTCTEGEYPNVVLQGVIDNSLTVFPDQDYYEVSAVVTNADNFKNVSYLWQKKDSRTNRWADTIYMESTLPLQRENANYRCRVIASTEDTDIIVMSDELNVNSKMRPLKTESFTASVAGRKPQAAVALKSAMTNCHKTPKGDVTFLIKQNNDIKASYSVALTEDEGNTAVASLPEQIELENGLYQISAFYGGDATFGSIETEPKTLIVGENDIFPKLYRLEGEHEECTSTLYYGDTLRIRFVTFKEDADGDLVETLLTNVQPTDMEITQKPGNYTLKIVAKTTEKEVECEYSLTVKPRPVEIGLTPCSLSKGDVEGKLPKLQVFNGSLAKGDSLDELVEIHYYGDDGNVPMDPPNNNSEAGNYLAVPEPFKVQGDNKVSFEKAEYYDLTLNAEKIAITREKYSVKLLAVQENKKQVGSITVITNSETQKDITDATIGYNFNTDLKLQAVPIEGYQFDHWEVTKNGETTLLKTATITETVYDYPIEIAAYFSIQMSTLKVDNSMNEGGILILPEGFVNGESYPVNTEFTFEMKEDENYNPDHWDILIGGKQTTDKNNVITVTVGATPTVLYPVFVGKPCKLTLDNRLSAAYAPDGYHTVAIPSGTTVPKFSMITVSLNPDVTLAENEVLTVNGNPLKAKNGSYSFKLNGDSTVSIEIAQTQVTTTTATTTSDSTTTTTVSSSVDSVTTTSTTYSSNFSVFTTTSTDTATTLPTTTTFTDTTTTNSSSTTDTFSTTGTTSTTSVTTTTSTTPQPGTLFGDVNLDGNITADDAQMALMAYIYQLASKPSVITAQQEKIADVDGNETITADDAQYILMYAVKKLAGLNPEWSDIIQK